jgi:outer membrane protein
MKQQIMWCMAAGLLIGAPVLAADSVKIGYVDVRAVLVGSKSGKQHKADIDKFINDKQSALKKEEDKLKSLQQTLEKEILTLTEAQKQEKQRSFQEKVQAFQKMAQDAEREVRQKDTEYTNMAVEEIRKIITDVAKDEKVGLVLGKAEVLYADDGMDLTSKVIQKYDSRPAPKK